MKTKHSAPTLTPEEATELQNRLKTMTISQIASLIYSSWKPVHFTARPYADAMLDLQTVNDKYGLDDGKGIILYFLNNASTWRGVTAKLVKDELKRRIK